MDVLRFAEYKTYNKAEIMALYSSVGWSNYTNNPAMLRKVYKNSLYVLAAYADGKLVGILRAVGISASWHWFTAYAEGYGKVCRCLSTAAPYRSK